MVKNKKLINTIFYALLAFVTMVTLILVFSPPQKVEAVPISALIAMISEEKVEKIVVEGNQVKAYLKDGKTVAAKREGEESFLTILKNYGIEPGTVEVTVEEGVPWLDLVINFLPVVLLIFFFFLIFRQARGGAMDVFSFGRAKARLFGADQPRVKFSDVAGVDEASKELAEVVDFLKNPGKYRALGARIPKGVLLVGPSGTGKTLLARAIAGEAGVPFYSMAGSEFMEMLVGVGASRVRDLFDMAKKTAPAIIFIDEIESIGRQRGFGFTGGHEEREQTLNQILVEMDGFTPNDNVIVVSATNRPDLLDPALTRPGRFDRRVVLDLPDIEGRKGIFKIHMRGKPFAQDLDIEKLARRTVGFSGADIENMLNEAAILAASLGKKAIDMKDLEEAATKVKLGPEKKRLQSEEERRITAYHEGGHALVSSQLPHMDPVHRVSIVSRGVALGFTEIPPQVDRSHQTMTRILEQITTLLGGRAAEEIVFSDLTVGAANDIEHATELARRMVTEFGMSALGPITWETSRERFLREFGESLGYSEKTGAEIDGEVKKIIGEAYKKAKEIVVANREKLDRVAQKLVEQETLEAEEFQRLIKS